MSAPTAPAFPASRPAALSRFVGRSRELAAIVDLMAAHRLVTLTGAGGSGKTRLALESLTRVGHRSESAVWIDLAQLQEAGGVVNHVAAGFGLSERDAGQALADLKHLLGERSVLLVLDNCEHVVDVVAQLAESLLADLPGLAILATSREALGVQGETAWLVPPLGSDEACELFVDRARAVTPTFAPTAEAARRIADICRRLDGIPLAIELAAARVRVLSVDQIAERLEDSLRLLSGGRRTAVPRHRTLRSTIEWSYGLLEPDEQVLLRRLAVFPASFSLEAAEAVAADELLAAEDVLDVLSGLVEKSLLMLDADESDARYRMLETVRQFGAERLAETGEAEALARRHAEHYLAVAEAAAPRIFGGASPRILRTLVPETPNFRVAVEWCAATPARYEQGLRFCWGLQWFWWGRGSFTEVSRIPRPLDPAEPVDRLIRIRSLIAFCQMGCWQGRFDEAEACGRAAVAGLEPGDTTELRAIALTMLGAALVLTNQLDEALQVLAEAKPLGADSGTNISGIAHHFTGMVLAAQGRLEESYEQHSLQYEILKSRDVEHGRTHGRSAQGGIRFEQGRIAEAIELFRDGLVVGAATPDYWGIAKGIEGLALCDAETDPARAARLLGAAEALRERIAHPMWVDEVRRYEPVAAQLRARLGDRFAPIWSEGRLLSDRDAIAEALARTEAPTGPSVAEAPPRDADLVVRALGRVEVVRAGRPIEANEWGSARPRELLMYLLSHPGGVSKERVGAALWPEASPTQLRNNFHVTVHRLRKTLGNPDWITSANDSYAVAPEVVVDFDAARFEQEVRAGIAGLKRGETGVVDVLGRALDRYRGHFLEDESAGDWAAEHRDRLLRVYVDGALAWARALMDAGRLDPAAEMLRAVTARDPLTEAAWAALMVCHSRRQDPTQALRTFQQYQAVLASELETEPGPAISELRDRLQRGEVL